MFVSVGPALYGASDRILRPGLIYFFEERQKKIGGLLCRVGIEEPVRKFLLFHDGVTALSVFSI